MADLRVAKRQARDKMFYDTFDKIFVSPIERQKRKIDENDERIVNEMIQSMIDYAESPEGSKELSDQILYLEHPEMDPNFYQKIVDEYCFGNTDGEMNEEYWNDYNQDDPLEAHPKCIGDTSQFKGFDDSDLGQKFLADEAKLIAEVRRLGGDV